MKQKPNRQELPGLLLIATPLGNLSDLSPRAREALSSVSLLLAEDTRVTRKLYAALGLKCPSLVALDAHRERKDLASVVEEIRRLNRAGSWVGLVADAGTPAISDPGARLVRACQEARIPVSGIPGPSALSLALSLCGLLADRVVWNGFFPRKAKEEVSRLQASSGAESTLQVWFESPDRIRKTVEALGEAFPEEDLWVGKELTKFFEETWVGRGAALAAEFSKIAEPMGEWVLVLRHPGTPEVLRGDFDGPLACLREAGVSLSQAVAITQKQFDARHRDVYEAALRVFKKSGNRG